MPTSSFATSEAPLDYVAPSRFWRWLAALAILGNIALNYYANVHPFKGQTMGEVSAKNPTLLTPANYAFSIWGLIFLALVVYAGWQLLPAQRQNPLPDVVARPLTIASLATAAWVVVFSQERIVLSLVVMLIILVALAIAYGEAQDLIQAKVARYWAGIPLGLYLGWISVATTINLTVVLSLSVHLGASQEVTVAYGVIAIVVILALIIARVFQDRAFPLMVAWALVGIWRARLGEVPDLAWVALAAAVATTLFGFVLAQVGSRKAPWEIAAEAATAAEAEIAAAKAAKTPKAAE
jgi:hypothetical protein